MTGTKTPQFLASSRPGLLSSDALPGSFCAPSTAPTQPGRNIMCCIKFCFLCVCVLLWYYRLRGGRSVIPMHSHVSSWVLESSEAPCLPESRRFIACSFSSRVRAIGVEETPVLRFQRNRFYIILGRIRRDRCSSNIDRSSAASYLYGAP